MKHFTQNRKEKCQKYKTTLDIYLHHIQFNRIIVYLPLCFCTCSAPSTHSEYYIAHLKIQLLTRICDTSKTKQKKLHPKNRGIIYSITGKELIAAICRCLFAKSTQAILKYFKYFLLRLSDGLRKIGHLFASNRLQNS